jgi:hypothetical protein
MYCKNNPKKTYTGLEPSPKGLGFCASGEKEGAEMKGKDGNMWVKKDGKWVKAISKEYYGELIYNKLIKWWRKLAQGNIIAIYKNGKYKFITSQKKTHKAFYKDISEKWKKLDANNDVKCIIWSAQSVDIIQSFIDYIVQKLSIKKLEGLVKMKNIPEYLLKNYKKYLEIKITHSNCRLFSKF